jgi:hypothetical protein
MVHPLFNQVVMFTIILNCIQMMFNPDPSQTRLSFFENFENNRNVSCELNWVFCAFGNLILQKSVELSEWVFLGLYTVEYLVRALARGFLLHPLETFCVILSIINL